MAVMKRGSNVELTREIPGLTGLVIGVHWNAGTETVLEDNLVVATILCRVDGKAISNEHFVFFNQLDEPTMSVAQLTMALGSDSEQIEVRLADVPPEVARIVVALYINEGIGLRRSLSQLKELQIRVLNLADNVELVRSENLAVSLNGETALSLGEVYRRGPEWKFKVIGEGYGNGVTGLLRDYGLPQ
jgi:tellurium resistance protein TerD